MPLILDGEMVALKESRPDFFQIMKRDRLKNEGKIKHLIPSIPAYYVVFDILYMGNEWMTAKPLCERLHRLEFLKKKMDSPLIQICTTFESPDLLLEFTKQEGWEGIVMKEREGRYHIGEKHTTWRKFKHYKMIEATVVEVELRSNSVHSVLLGIEEEERWKYIGKASLGLRHSEMDTLFRWAQSIMRDYGLIDLPSYKGKNILWVNPLLKVKVRYLEFTPDGTLRSPVIQGFVLN
jgi:bifunctional non-homologous end joining protein LigD